MPAKSPGLRMERPRVRKAGREGRGCAARGAGALVPRLLPAASRIDAGSLAKPNLGPTPSSQILAISPQVSHCCVSELECNNGD